MLRSRLSCLQVSQLADKLNPASFVSGAWRIA